MEVTYLNTKLNDISPAMPRTEPTQSIFSFSQTGVSLGMMIARLPNIIVPNNALPPHESAAINQRDNLNCLHEEKQPLV